MSEHLDKLKQCAVQREADISDTTGKIKTFNDMLDLTAESVETVRDAAAQQKPVGGDAENIRQQQEEFKVTRLTLFREKLRTKKW